MLRQHYQLSNFIVEEEAKMELCKDPGCTCGLIVRVSDQELVHPGDCEAVWKKLIKSCPHTGLGVWFAGEHNYFHCPFPDCQLLVYTGSAYFLHLLQYHQSSEPALFEALFGVERSWWLLARLEQQVECSWIGQKW